MRMVTNKVWRVGMLIYILCTAIGICYNRDFNFSPPLRYQATFLIPGGGVAGMDHTAPGRSQFSSSFELEEEDDDDSDRNFLIAFVNKTCAAHVSSEHLSTYYQQIGLDIITPPPKLV